MNGNAIVAKVLKAEGVEWITAYPEQKLIDKAAMEGIRPIITRQERTGVNMADAFSRINNGRKIGVFTMQRGPGAENAFSGVAQAYADSVPLLVLPGGAGRDRIRIHPGFDSIDHYGGITKFSGHLTTVERIQTTMRYAFTQLKHGRLGPVMIEIPDDVGLEEIPDDAFDYTPVEVHRSEAAPDDVRDLVTALLKATTPIINAGQGVLYAQATDELVEFAELTNIPVLTTLAGKSGYPENHPLALGTGAASGTLMVARFLKKTDFCLGLGTSFTLSGFNAPMPPGIPLAQVTNCAEDLNKDYNVDYAAVGDAKLVLRQMIEEAKRQLGEHGRGDVHGFRDEIASIKAEFMGEWGPRLNSDEVPISPYRVITELKNAVDVKNTIVTHDSGYPREQLVPFWEPTAPNGYIGWGKSTQLGYGLGLVLGAKLAAPEKTVVNIMGDAAFGMAGLDIETAARAEIGTLTIILNNGVMTHYSTHMPYATEHYKSNEFSGEYAKVAEGLGAHAQRVVTPDEVGPSIKKALKVTETGQPAVIEMITKEEETIAKFW